MNVRRILKLRRTTALVAVIGALVMAATASFAAGALESGPLGTHQRAVPSRAAVLKRIKRELRKHQRPVAHASGSTTYASLGLTVTPASSGALAPLALSSLGTPSAAIASFGSQPAAIDLLHGATQAATPSAAVEQVTETEPTYPGLTPGVTYPAWVVTVGNVPPVTTGGNYSPTGTGGSSGLAGARCDVLGVYDLTIGAWTEFVETSCN